MMMMTEQQTHGLVCCDQLPPLCAKSPWLVAECVDDNGISGHYFYNIHDPLSYYRCRIPELLGKVIRGFFHGWVILSSNALWSLWNPLTSQLIRVPPLKNEDFDDDIGQCCLSSPPNGPGSVLLLTRAKKPVFVFCRLDCKRKKLRWTEMSYAKQLKRITIDGSLVYSLTCCDGKVFALSTDGTVSTFVIQIDIAVKDKEVVIKLLVFGPCPSSDYKEVYGEDELIDNYNYNYFLKGSCTELFCIIVEGTSKNIASVTLHKLDMTGIKWEELEGLKNWDLSNTRVEELRYEDVAGLQIIAMKWEEMSDLKNALFFVDFERGCSIFYNSVISSELGGYIHIRGETDNLMFSYHVNCRTILPSTIPFPVLPTSHVLMWEYRLDDDYGEAKCTVDSKQQEDEIVVRSVTNDEVGFNKSRLLSIPFDILETILKFCVGVEYLNFRATCKRCHLAAPLSECHNETSLRRLQCYSLVSPWLVVLDTNRGLISFTDPMFGDQYFMKNSQISIVKGSGIYCSRFGCLLVRVIDDEHPRLVFLNPFTKEIRKLPVSFRIFDSLCISAPPTSPNCMVIGFKSRNKNTRAHIFYVAPQPTPRRDAYENVGDYLLVSGGGLIEPTWRTLELGDNIRSIRFPTFHGGDLYALCNEGKLIVFKHLLEEDYSWKVIEAKIPGSGCKSEAQYYMTKCDQHLLVVIVGEFENSVEVFKYNDLAEEWEKVDDLGKHMIYVSDTMCLCIDAQTPEMGNKIYFPFLHPTNRKVVFYSLETCLFHTFNGRNMEQYLGGLCSTVHHHNPLGWIEPSWC